MLDQALTELSGNKAKMEDLQKMQNSVIIDDFSLHKAISRSVMMEQFLHTYAVDILNVASDPIEFFRRSLTLGMKIGYHLNNIEKRGMS